MISADGEGRRRYLTLFNSGPFLLSPLGRISLIRRFPARLLSPLRWEFIQPRHRHNWTACIAAHLCNGIVGPPKFVVRPQRFSG